MKRGYTLSRMSVLMCSEDTLPYNEFLFNVIPECGGQDDVEKE